MVPCTFDRFILTFEHFEYGLTKLPTLKKYNKWCILTFNYKVALILNGLDHSGIAKHNVTSSLLHVTQQLPIQIPPPQRIFLCVKKWRGQENLDFFTNCSKLEYFSSSSDILKTKLVIYWVWKSSHFIQFEFYWAWNLWNRTSSWKINFSSFSLNLETSFTSFCSSIPSISSFIEFAFLKNINHQTQTSSSLRFEH